MYADAYPPLSATQIRKMLSNITGAEAKSQPLSSKRKFLVLIDYDNIDSQLRDKEMAFDFAGLMLELIKLGKVKHAFLFIPFESYYGLENINNLGYEIIICQKTDRLSDSDKREDKVDSRIQLITASFLEYDEITDIVILTHDKHSIETASEAIKAGKKITYFAMKDKMAKQLLDFLKKYKMEVKELPTKNRY